MGIFKNYLDKDIEEIEGGGGGSADLTNYEGESISLSAAQVIALTSDGSDIELIATTGGILLEAGNDSDIDINSQGTNGRINLNAQTTLNLTVADSSGLLEISTSSPLNIASTENNVNIEALGVDAAVSIESSKLAFFGVSPVERPEIPAVPIAQDLADVLVALGLVTQAVA